MANRVGAAASGIEEREPVVVAVCKQVGGKGALSPILNALEPRLLHPPLISVCNGVQGRLEGATEQVGAFDYKLGAGDVHHLNDGATDGAKLLPQETVYLVKQTGAATRVPKVPNRHHSIDTHTEPSAAHGGVRRSRSNGHGKAVEFTRRLVHL
jgi:hypothetical protein